MRARGSSCFASASPGRFLSALALALALAAPSIAGCSHGAAATFEGTSYRDSRVAFDTGRVPPEWRRIEVDDATLAFRDDPHAGTTMVNARCNDRDDDVPLGSLTAHLIIGTTERKTVREDLLAFDGREALHTEMRAKLDGVLLGYDIFVAKKDGCVYDFVYVAPPDRYDEGARGFETFVMGFRARAPRRAGS